MKTQEKNLVRISLPARADYLGPVLSLVKSIAGMEGFEQKEMLHIETFTEEALANVIEHAFDPGEEGTYDLFIIREPGRIVIAIEDQGLPFDHTVLESGEQGGLGLKLMKGLADEVKFMSLGKKGKRVELVKYLPREDPESLLTEEDRKTLENKEVLSQESVYFRMMKPEDAVGLTRCVYRTYGYSYGSDYIYNPSEVREMLASGIIESFLAVTPSDEIVAHLAMIYHKPGARVAESGQAVVDTRFRGRKLFEQMKIQLLDYAREKGLYGIYSEATTLHPYSQKGNITLGAVETGFMLGMAPENVAIRTIESSSKEMRLTGLLYYLKTSEEPERTVYLPDKHKDMLIRMINRIKLNRNYDKPSFDHLFRSATLIRTKIRPEWGHALITAESYGFDFMKVIKPMIREIKLQKIAVIYLDLPLSNPATPYHYAEMEKLGFSFSCFIPEYEEGDVIRMQLLVNFELDPKKISVASEEARELLDYVMKEIKN